MTTLKAKGSGGNGQGLAPFGFGWKTCGVNLFLLSLGTGIWREREEIRHYKRQTELHRGLSALTSMILDRSAASTAFLTIAHDRQGTFVSASLGDMQDLYVIDAPLLTFRWLSPTLEGTWLEEKLGPEFNLRPGAVRRLRKLDWAHPSNFSSSTQSAPARRRRSTSSRLRISPRHSIFR